MARGFSVRALVRFPDAFLSSLPIETIATGPIEHIDDWRSQLVGVDAVVHLAARAQAGADGNFGEAQMRAVNVGATLSLAQSAARRKVPHFVYLSSVKVLGDRSPGDSAFRADAPFDPQDMYARSKAEAELGLRDLSANGQTGMTILRPPLVYGAGARGNFRALCRLVRGAPALPFASVKSRRSLIAVENLAAAIVAAIENPGNNLRTYLLSDGEDFSLPELIRLIADGQGKRCTLFPVPIGLLNAGARLVGQTQAMLRLTQPLRLDAAPFRRDFSWRNAIDPSLAMKAAAMQCARS